ncbi:MAG: hypothetical protein LBR91_02130 [Puniceicoccales bacterium]|jgi:hypothetical protein|nr:hypothetical protein [Puniceicoccales bacterium]
MNHGNEHLEAGYVTPTATYIYIDKNTGDYGLLDEEPRRAILRACKPYSVWPTENNNHVWEFSLVNLPRSLVEREIKSMKAFTTSVDASDDNGQIKRIEVSVRVVLSEIEVSSGESLSLHQVSRMDTMTAEEMTEALARGTMSPGSPPPTPPEFTIDESVFKEMDEFGELVDEGVKIAEKHNVPEVFVSSNFNRFDGFAEPQNFPYGFFNVNRTFR